MPATKASNSTGSPRSRRLEDALRTPHSLGAANHTRIPNTEVMSEMIEKQLLKSAFRPAFHSTTIRICGHKSCPRRHTPIELPQPAELERLIHSQKVRFRPRLQCLHRPISAA